MPDQLISTNNQPISKVNKHIEEYLDYYCNLTYSPQFAVLLKGQWGCGKSWFINRYIQKLKDIQKLKEGSKTPLYVSLYGVNSFSQIDDLLFEQIHPILSSKGAKIAGKVLKGLLSKWVVNIDTNSDKKFDGNVQPSLPEISIKDLMNPSVVKDSQYSILVFDDLERCGIEIESILGYINSFVESEYLKVVIIADEDKIINQEKYRKVKEKLISKTFEVHPDIQSALNCFINKLQNENTKEFLLKNIGLIEELYRQAECKNLRIVNQIGLDFERLFENLPEKAQNKAELLKEVLELLSIFSIEISYGRLKPENISQIDRELGEELVLEIHKAHTNSAENNANSEKNQCFLEIFKKYINIYNMYIASLGGVLPFAGLFPSLLWWELFFDKGIIDQEILEKLMPNSKYFYNENTPNWIKLYDYTRHTDEDFEKILNQVESEYFIDKKIENIAIIKHITGLFLVFSDAGIYSKSKADIIKEAQKYIDVLNTSNKLDIKYKDTFVPYMGREFIAKNYPEFRDFDNYIKQIQEEVRLQNMPSEANKILKIMQNNITDLQSIICAPGSSDPKKENYYDYPIFKHLPPEDFMNTVLIVMSSNEDKNIINYIFYCLKIRYTSSHESIVRYLVEELDFLKNFQELLLAEIGKRKGKISGYLLNQSNELSLKDTISYLEQIKQSFPQNLRDINNINTDPYQTTLTTPLEGDKEGYNV
ncbi:P-loop NTPase fold protein [Kamptonema sp. UHCC 0994]|uniref:P-loop NTPase fold protein n=1 Tax=Kamptonema sp. UHCC 0994 TaxID=3031329 RepID=UPI0023BA38B5|nr:P-loop NTPase fold protein [Kamptonema sp. UHCC 0994]MDF0552289.1 P-loop NTPase fold protein [Kamptonema sp. UHCC 0994]